jgi:hypothetical protein
VSDWKDVAGKIAVELAQEALSWLKRKATEKAREKAGQLANAIDPAVLEAMVAAELSLIFRGWTGVEGFEAEIAAAEARGRAHPVGLQLVECCSCETPELVLEGNGTTRCARCNKPDFASLKLDEAP